MSLYPVSRLKASALVRTFLIIFASSVIMAGCTTTRPAPSPNQPQQQTPQQQPDPQTQTPEQPVEVPKDPETEQPPVSTTSRDGLTPPFMAGKKIKRIALLLPFSSGSDRLRAEAQSMLQAAELSLFSRNEDDVLLIALDSAGTPDGARNATKNAIAQGADVILGPILAGSVKASGREARRAGVPVIAFSTDTTVAGGGVYLLSFPPEAEVRRVTQFVAESGARKFAFLGPDSTYGKRVLGAYQQHVRNIGGIINGVETYTGNDISVMQEPAQKLAQRFTNSVAASGGDNVAYHAVMLPEGGTPLRSLAPLLTYFEEDLRGVQLMGTGLWHRDEVVREPALKNGVFAGPDMEARQEFNGRYDATYGAEPSRLSSLAYDAVNIGAYIASIDKRDQTRALTEPAGFYGVDGLVRFTASGTPERGLAVYQVRNGRFVVIDPAPKTSDGAF
ncbi:MAG: penicillin-binding protein activator [Hyphomonadaceae bacterium]|nr:penicillin-binding protein activator [Hyphomonadaceae bacterium]